MSPFMLEEHKLQQILVNIAINLFMDQIFFETMRSLLFCVGNVLDAGLSLYRLFSWEAGVT